MHEAALDFLVRIVEVVCEKIRIKILDGQISSLVHQCYRGRAHVVRSRQRFHRNVVLRYIVQVIVALLQVSHQECRRPSLEPVHPEFARIECVQKTERIIHADAVFTKMIAIIHWCQFLVAFFFRKPVHLRKSLHAFTKIWLQFLLWYSADVSISGIHRYVIQIVKSAEDAHFTQFGHPCQEREPDGIVLSLYDTVEALELAPELLHKFRIVNVVDYRLFIFIDEDDDLLAGLSACRVNDVFKPGRQVFGHRCDVIQWFPLAKMLVKAYIQLRDVSIRASRQIQVQNRIFRPLLLQRLHRKTFEKFFSATEIRLHSRHEQTLSKSSRATQKIIFAGGSQPIDESSLIYINITAISNFFKTLYSYRVQHIPSSVNNSLLSWSHLQR